MDKITEDKIISLYINDKLSPTKIGVILKLKVTEIRDYLTNKGVIRRKNDYLIKTSIETESEIANKYINGCSLSSLAKDYNFSSVVIKRCLRNHNIKLRDEPDKIRIKQLTQEDINSYKSGVSANEIAKKTGLHTATVVRRLRDANIKIRGAKKFNKRARKFNKETDIKIANEYLSEKKSCCSLAKKYNCSNSVIRRILLENDVTIEEGRHKNKYYEINENYFSNLDGAEKYFILGLMFSDGTIVNKDSIYTMKLELQESDKCMLEYILKCLSSNHPLSYRKKKSTWKFLIANRTIVNDLVKCGCVQNKTEHMKYPAWLRDDLFAYFLSGYIMGDGCLFSNGKDNSVTITGKSEVLKKFKKNIHKLTGLTGYITNCSSTDSVINLVYGGINNYLKLCNFIFKNSCFIMPRKFKIFENTVKNRIKLPNRVKTDILNESIKICEEVNKNFAYLLK